VAKVWLHSTGDASPPAALLLVQILPVFSVVAPCGRGASPVSVRRQTFTTGCYSAAMKVAFSTGFAAALPLFKRAVEIEPQFAMAYASMGLMYSNIGESVLSTESTSKAYQLRDRANDRERFFITAVYDRQVTGNLEKERQTLEL